MRQMKDDMYELDPNKKMQTLKGVEDMIYQMINNPYEHINDVSYNDIKSMSDANSSVQSLSDKIREMIRHDRGLSLIYSTDSGGIPSPIRESESFKKLFEYKESEATSEFNSRKVKKIEFSDTMTKGKNTKKEKKGEVDKEKHANFTYSSIDRMIFEDTNNIDDNIEVGLNDIGDGSIAETVKRNDSKLQFDYAYRDTSEKKLTKNVELIEDKSFDQPAELTQELKKYSLRSSIDIKFYEELKVKDIDMSGLEIPSINNSLLEHHPVKQIGGKLMYENTEIHQDSVSHRDGSNLKKRGAAPPNANEKKATKKEFESQNNELGSANDINPEDIDRNSTVKKVGYYIR